MTLLAYLKANREVSLYKIIHINLACSIFPRMQEYMHIYGWSFVDEIYLDKYAKLHLEIDNCTRILTTNGVSLHKT